jgi:prepilin-type processing-associated H-X9-DG protein/prepilin-type N-terminal cleavage/methylation domain-containing protein
MRASHQSNRTAFTLTELLVVIAIIGTLAAIMLPALTRAMWRARLIHCVNNVRQLGLGLHQFADDNLAYPLMSHPEFNSNNIVVHFNTWEESIQPQLGKINPGWFQQNVWTCPGVRSKGALKGGFASYGYNAFGFSAPGIQMSSKSFGLGGHTVTLMNTSGHTISMPKVVNTPVKAGEVASPSEMMAIADGFEGSGDQLYAGQSLFWRESIFSGGFFNTTTVNARHQGKANVVFCDGHVESPTLKFLFEDTADAALSRWNRDHLPHRDRL